jgi:hypothetical protein
MFGQGKSMFGQQPISQRRSSPSYGFGTGTRGHAAKVFMGPEHAKTYNYGISTRHGVPYNAIDAVGPQQDSGKNSPPVWNFGTAERFRNTGRQSALLPGMATEFGEQSVDRCARRVIEKSCRRSCRRVGPCAPRLQLHQASPLPPPCRTWHL